jgi:uncharacterized membrane protein YqiK
MSFRDIGQIINKLKEERNFDRNQINQLVNQYITEHLRVHQQNMQVSRPSLYKNISYCTR